jgi:aryl-alcohol dehydrogenase-like predicted oxidoreductase
VQLPFNAIDRRLVHEGQIDRLNAQRVEIHARSVFLQGLLLQQPEDIAERFAPISRSIRTIVRWGAARRFSQLEAVLALAFAERRIDRFILGVTTVAELDEIADALCSADKLGELPELDLPSDLHPRFLNPARWRELG